MKIKTIKLSTTELVNIFTLLRDIKSKSINKNTQFLFRDLTKALRLKAKCFDHSVKVITNNKNQAPIIYFGETINERLVEFKNAKNTFNELIRIKRGEQKKLTAKDKNFNGIKYKLVGGVFAETNTILSLMSSAQLARMEKPKKPQENDTRNYVGVELEFISTLDRDELKQALAKKYLGGYVYIKDDSSINKEKDADHTHEITILAPQNNYKQIISRVCEVLNEKTAGAYVNNSCGMHIHIDMRHRNPDNGYHNFVESLPLTKNLVPKTRIEGSQGNRYCRINNNSVFATEGDDRYWAINGKNAYKKYKTIEVRMHSGTLNATKINNWIEIFLLLADAPTLPDKLTSPKQFQEFTQCDSKLVEYMTNRYKLFQGEMALAVDTRADHFFYSGDMYV